MTALKKCFFSLAYIGKGQIYDTLIYSIIHLLDGLDTVKLFISFILAELRIACECPSIYMESDLKYFVSDF